MRSSLRSASLALLAWLAQAETSYWIEPCTRPETGCLAGDAELARWALEAWQSASEGRLKLTPTPERARAPIRVLWADPHQGLYGEARPILVDGKRGAELNIRFAVPRDAGRLLRDAIVYLTCLHESGHALGLPHTAAFDDIMYSFQYGGDIGEYFGRYRRRLTVREDIRKYAGLSEADRAELRKQLGR